MKFCALALIGMAVAIRTEKGDEGLIDQVLSKPGPDGCEKRLWINDDEMRW